MRSAPFCRLSHRSVAELELRYNLLSCVHVNLPRDRCRDATVGSHQSVASNCRMSIPADTTFQKGDGWGHMLIYHNHDDCQRAPIVPIFKKKDNSDCNSYRWIRLLRHNEKICASVLGRRIRTRTEEILTEAQTGCRQVVYVTRYCREVSRIWDRSVRMLDRLQKGIR